jgi:hypothetical protein
MVRPPRGLSSTSTMPTAREAAASRQSSDRSSCRYGGAGPPNVALRLSRSIETFPDYSPKQVESECAGCEGLRQAEALSVVREREMSPCHQGVVPPEKRTPGRLPPARVERRRRPAAQRPRQGRPRQARCLQYKARVPPFPRPRDVWLCSRFLPRASEHSRSPRWRDSSICRRAAVPTCEHPLRFKVRPKCAIEEACPRFTQPISQSE